MINLFGRSKFYSFLLSAALLLAAGPALAEKRVALVIGNAAYQNVPRLPNPVNDGNTIAATLKNAGFDVVDNRRDLSAADTRRALRDFSDRARDADIAVVYYAGHGIEVDGGNYLIPVDARLERDTDVYDEALSLDRVLIAVEPAKKLRLVILDACRDNPFSKNMKRTVASRAIGQGLAKIEPTSQNLLIAYSAKAGSTAADGDGNNSPFTVALSHHLTTPGLDVRRAFGYVRDDVLKTTNNRQEPFVYGSLGGDDVPLVPAPKVAATAPSAAPVASPQADMRRDYELALQIGNKSALNAFLAQYPDGFYASLAKLQLEKLTAEEIRVAATEKARQAEQERTRLAAEGAQKAAQAKAEADAKAAEQARIAAEKAKEVAQAQAAAAEQKRVEAEKSAAEVGTRVAAVAPAANLASLSTGAPQADVTKSVQTELRRVGCLSAEADGNWNTTSQRSLSLFNRYANTKLDTKLASTDALDSIKTKTARVCPLVCDRGFKPQGDSCVKIVCAEGSFLNDNECEKRREKKPVATRDSDQQDRPAKQRPQATSRGDSSGMPGGYGAAAGAGVAKRAAGGGAGGSVFCNSSGCRPVTRGCHLEYRGGGGPGNDANAEVCN